MRVLLFHYWELAALGGVEVAVLAIARGLVQCGCVTGIVETGGRWKPRYLLPGDIPVWSITAPSLPTALRPQSWVSLLRATLQFWAVLREFQPDVVHVHYPDGQSPAAVAAHLLPHRWRLVVTVHNSDIRVAPFLEPRLRPWQNQLFHRADAVTSVSKALLEDAVRLYPCISGKAQVIYNGVGGVWFEEDAARPDIQEKYVLFVGRLHPMKGADNLLHAWSRICSRVPDTMLWLAGDGPERDTLLALASKLNIRSSVRFLGAKPHAELRRLYRNAELVVLPSRREGFPLTLLEAGASGAVCLATRVPGVPELIEDSVNGFLVEPESPEALADGILRALELPPDARRRLGEAARNVIRQRHTENQMVSSYLGLYESLFSPRS